MSAAPVVGLEARGRVFGSLESAVRVRGPEGAEARLAELRAFLQSDLEGIERELDALELAPTSMHASAGHLLGAGGKRLRPLCVALAARAGAGFSSEARDLAVAAELVHAATLLHDDVVDLGERRRGLPAARMIYGNAASIFAGDWLLVEALVRVRRTGLYDVLDRALGVLTEMLDAEALQLERRGKLDGSSEATMRIILGKTASLFRWSLFAGARAGGLDERACHLLEGYGERLGVAFQITDDLLDVEGDPEQIGKDLFGDLREGKATYPLMLALEREPELAGELAACVERGAVDGAMGARVLSVMRRTGAVDDARRCAEGLVAEANAAVGELSRELGPRPALRALTTVAETIATRRN